MMPAPRRTPGDRARRAALADAAVGGVPVEPVDGPAPAPGCDVCEALARQRIVARRDGDFSRVVDCDVELRRHPHGRRR
ncbi:MULTISPECIES: hypothetical protein [Streptomyces]|uniref:hypothetical protein n=1 Tax=Streptomyces TaxID=1883 RepID=UPI00163C91DD|nr:MULTISPECIES: hypothetical protein [Streptomyces]MBC2878873.1 hypothetical protein [Streptomyces sp. TYQ1024]UBI41384.1 hypothetical protein K7I03_22445 [Streptomyces mobaraensis]UKW33880.1 hypothetical protein MCU78_22390 [Streptomyces sp. TYQ1024]